MNTPNSFSPNLNQPPPLPIEQTHRQTSISNVELGASNSSQLNHNYHLPSHFHNALHSAARLGFILNSSSAGEIPLSRAKRDNSPRNRNSPHEFSSFTIRPSLSLPRYNEPGRWKFMRQLVARPAMFPFFSASAFFLRHERRATSTFTLSAGYHLPGDTRARVHGRVKCTFHPAPMALHRISGKWGGERSL